MFMLLLGLGAFAIYCSWTDSDWFFSGRKSQRFVRLFGRNGARRYYFWLGVAFVLAAFASLALPSLMMSLAP